MIVRLVNSDKYCILQCLSSALRLKLISKLLDRKTIISDMTVFSELFIRQNSYNRSICTCYSCSALLAGREQQVREYLCISVRARRLEPWRHGVHVGGRHFGGTRGHHRSDDQLQAGDLWWVRPPQIFKLHGHWKSSQRNLLIFFFIFVSIICHFFLFCRV